MNTAIESIQAHDHGRDVRRLALKYERMAVSAFAFTRGTCHRFYEQMPVAGPTRHAPAAWICGDAHFENFGSFKGKNRLTYFDLNDFDEACLAPCTWDVVRFQSSLLLGAHAIGVPRSRAQRMARGFVESYRQALADGKPRWIEPATARGLVKELLDGLRQRRRRDFLDERAPVRGRHRRIRIGGKNVEKIKALPTVPACRESVHQALEKFGRTRKAIDFFRVLDVADRVAGAGSLGLDRYVVLVQGKGTKHKNALLDLKRPPSSTPARQSPCQQPPWKSEAERVVTIQDRLQAVAPAFLEVIDVGRDAHVLRELMPSEDRVELSRATAPLERLTEAVGDMAQALAWAHLRGAGRQGAESPDALVAHGSSRSWTAPLTKLALETARQAERDHREFRQAWRDGVLASSAGAAAT